MFEYQGIKINYKDYGNKEGSPIVYLHGWGQNIEMMEPIAKPFQKKHRLIILDLPGFGASEEPKEVWSLEDFVEMLHELLKSLQIEKPSLIGHSFGGKIALLYASKYKTNKLLLLSSPYKVKIKKQSLKVRILKKAAKVPGLNKLSNSIKKHLGSTDYKNASPKMRDILVKHVNTDLTEVAKKITCPTFIIWGSKDEAVPVSDAYELEKIIDNCGLVVYENCTHYAYLERVKQTIAIIESFIK